MKPTANVLKQVRNHYATLFAHPLLEGDDDRAGDTPELDLDEYESDDLEEPAFCIGYIQGAADALEMTAYALLEEANAGLELQEGGAWTPVTLDDFWKANHEADPDREDIQCVARLEPGEECLFGGDVLVRRRTGDGK